MSSSADSSEPGLPGRARPPAWRLLRAVRLVKEDRWLLLEAWLLVVAVRLGLSLLPVGRVRRMLARLGAGDGAESLEGAGLSQRVARAVRLARRLAPATRCLAMALAAQAMLARRGLRARLRVGVARDPKDAEIRGHAWLEHDSRIVLGGAEAASRFEPVPISFLESGL